MYNFFKPSDSTQTFLGEVLIRRLETSVRAQVALLLIVSVLFWAFGVPTFIKPAHAAYMSLVSDTLSDSNNGSASVHSIAFTNATSTTAGQTIKIQLDPDTSAFTEYFSNATTTDITANGFTHVANLAACPGSGNSAYVSSAAYNNGTDENITFTVCPSNTISAGPISIKVGATSTKLWQNATTTGSYRILIAGTQLSSGETRVAILPHVTLTASVATIFTFTVSAVPQGNTVGGDVTTSASTQTTIPFGTLASGTPKIIAQRLNVTTNANNGFSVTVQEDQPPTSGAGSIIYLFKDGATTSVPTAWTAPAGTLGALQTYGHLGLTSTDADLNSNEFSNATLYAGNVIFPRVIFSHNGPADGSTNNIGSSTVAYKIQGTDLLAAGDYTNVLTYVATPTF
jgi:hypothetical protein